MASPSAPPPPPPPPPPSPPPPPPPALPPPPNDEGSSQDTNTMLKAYGIDPESVVALYVQNRNACYEDIWNMIEEVEPSQRENAAKAILDGYFAVQEFVDSKIDQTEVEITALEHRLEESKHLVEMTKSLSTLSKVPFPPDLDKKLEPADPANLKLFPHRSCGQCVREGLICSPDCMNYRFFNDRLLCSLIPSAYGSQSFNRLRQGFMDLERDPIRKFQIAKSLAYGTYRGAFSIGRQYGYQYYYEDQMRQNQLELDAARRTLREFRILRDIHHKAIVEGYYQGRNEGLRGVLFNDTTEKKPNTKKDKGKKIQKDKENAGGK